MGSPPNLSVEGATKKQDAEITPSQTFDHSTVPASDRNKFLEVTDARAGSIKDTLEKQPSSESIAVLPFEPSTRDRKGISIVSSLVTTLLGTSSSSVEASQQLTQHVAQHVVASSLQQQKIRFGDYEILEDNVAKLLAADYEELDAFLQKENFEELFVAIQIMADERYSPEQKEQAQQLIEQSFGATTPQVFEAWQDAFSRKVQAIDDRVSDVHDKIEAAIDRGAPKHRQVEAIFSLEETIKSLTPSELFFLNQRTKARYGVSLAERLALRSDAAGHYLVSLMPESEMALRVMEFQARLSSYPEKPFEAYLEISQFSSDAELHDFLNAYRQIFGTSVAERIVGHEPQSAQSVEEEEIVLNKLQLERMDAREREAILQQKELTVTAFALRHALNSSNPIENTFRITTGSNPLQDPELLEEYQRLFGEEYQDPFEVEYKRNEEEAYRRIPEQRKSADGNLKQAEAVRKDIESNSGGWLERAKDQSGSILGDLFYKVTHPVKTYYIASTAYEGAYSEMQAQSAEADIKLDNARCMGRDIAKASVVFEQYKALKKESDELFKQGQFQAAQSKLEEGAKQFGEAITILNQRGVVKISDEYFQKRHEREELFEKNDEYFDGYERRLKAARTITYSTAALASGQWWYLASLGGIALTTNAVEQGGHMALNGKSLRSAGKDLAWDTADAVKDVTISRLSLRLGNVVGAVGGRFVPGTGIISSTIRGAATGAVVGVGMDGANQTYDAVVLWKDKERANSRHITSLTLSERLGRLRTSAYVGMWGGAVGGGAQALRGTSVTSAAAGVTATGETAAGQSVLSAASRIRLKASQIVEYVGGMAVGYHFTDGDMADKILGASQGAVAAKVAYDVEMRRLDQTRRVLSGDNSPQIHDGSSESFRNQWEQSFRLKSTGVERPASLMEQPNLDPLGQRIRQQVKDAESNYQACKTKDAASASEAHQKLVQARRREQAYLRKAYYRGAVEENAVGTDPNNAGIQIRVKNIARYEVLAGLRHPLQTLKGLLPYVVDLTIVGFHRSAFSLSTGWAEYQLRVQQKIGGIAQDIESVLRRRISSTDPELQTRIARVSNVLAYLKTGRFWTLLTRGGQFMRDFLQLRKFARINGIEVPELSVRAALRSGARVVIQASLSGMRWPFVKLWQGMQVGWQALVSRAQTVWTSIREWSPIRVVRSVMSGIGTVISGIRTGFARTIGAISELIANPGTTLRRWGAGLKYHVTGLIQEAARYISNKIESLKTWTSLTAGRLKEALANILAHPGATVKRWSRAVVSSIVNAGRTVASAMWTVGKAIGQLIYRPFRPYVEAVKLVAKKIWTATKAVWNVCRHPVESLQRAWGTLKAYVGTQLYRIGEYIGRKWDDVCNTFRRIRSAAWKVMRSPYTLIESIETGINGVRRAVGQFGQGVWLTAREFPRSAMLGLYIGSDLYLARLLHQALIPRTPHIPLAASSYSKVLDERKRQEGGVSSPQQNKHAALLLSAQESLRQSRMLLEEVRATRNLSSTDQVIVADALEIVQRREQMIRAIERTFLTESNPELISQAERALATGGEEFLNTIHETIDTISRGDSGETPPSDDDFGGDFNPDNDGEEPPDRGGGGARSNESERPKSQGSSSRIEQSSQGIRFIVDENGGAQGSSQPGRPTNRKMQPTLEATSSRMATAELDEAGLLLDEPDYLSVRPDEAYSRQLAEDIVPQDQTDSPLLSGDGDSTVKPPIVRIKEQLVAEQDNLERLSEARAKYETEGKTNVLKVIDEEIARNEGRLEQLRADLEKLELRLPKRDVKRTAVSEEDDYNITARESENIDPQESQLVVPTRPIRLPEQTPLTEEFIPKVVLPIEQLRPEIKAAAVPVRPLISRVFPIRKLRTETSPDTIPHPWIMPEFVYYPLQKQQPQSQTKLTTKVGHPVRTTNDLDGYGYYQKKEDEKLVHQERHLRRKALLDVEEKRIQQEALHASKLTEDELKFEGKSVGKHWRWRNLY